MLCHSGPWLLQFPDAPALGRPSPWTLRSPDAPALKRSGPRTLRSSLVLVLGCSSPRLLWQSRRKHRATFCARPPRSSSVFVFGRFGLWSLRSSAALALATALLPTSGQFLRLPALTLGRSSVGSPWRLQCSAIPTPPTLKSHSTSLCALIHWLLTRVISPRSLSHFIAV